VRRLRIPRLALRWLVPACLAWLLVLLVALAEPADNREGAALVFLARHVLSSAPRPDPRIVIVALDDATLADPRLPKWGPDTLNRRSHAQLTRRLKEAGAAAIGLDIYFEEPSDNPFDDLELARAIEEAGNVVITLPAGANTAERGRERFKPLPNAFQQLSGLRAASPLVRRWKATETVIGVEIDQDAGGPRVPAFSQAIYAAYQEARGLPLPPDVGVLHGKEGGAALIMIRWPPWPAQAAFSRLSYRDVWDASAIRQRPQSVAGKVVLVGRVSNTGADDEHRTPVGSLPGVYVHAIALQTLMDRVTTRVAPTWAQNFAVLLVFLLVTLLAYRYPLGWATAFTTAVCLAIWALSLTLLLRARVWFDPVEPAVTAVAVLLVRLAWQTQAAGAALRRFVDPAVVNELVATGEIRDTQAEATVLFSDIRNYTDLSERLAPDQLLQTLNQHFAWMDAIIRRHSGEVNKHTGDAVMAFSSAASTHSTRSTLPPR
jgi:adenylate cyclase